MRVKRRRCNTAPPDRFSVVRRWRGDARRLAGNLAQHTGRRHPVSTEIQPRELGLAPARARRAVGAGAPARHPAGTHPLAPGSRSRGCTASKPARVPSLNTTFSAANPATPGRTPIAPRRMSPIVPTSMSGGRASRRNCVIAPYAGPAQATGGKVPERGTQDGSVQCIRQAWRQHPLGDSDGDDRDPEQVPRHDVDGAAHRQAHVGAVFAQIDRDLATGVAEADHQHLLLAVWRAVTVVGAVQQLAAKVGHAGQVGQVGLAVVAGGDDELRPRVARVRGVHVPAPVGATRLAHLLPEARLQAETARVVLQVVDHLLTRGIARAGSRKRQERQRSSAPYRYAGAGDRSARARLYPRRYPAPAAGRRCRGARGWPRPPAPPAPPRPRSDDARSAAPPVSVAAARHGPPLSASPAAQRPP